MDGVQSTRHCCCRDSARLRGWRTRDAMKDCHRVLAILTFSWFVYSSRRQDALLLRLEDGQCWEGNVNHTGVLQCVEGLKSSYALKDLLEGPGLEPENGNETRAACRFIQDDHTSHFPHAMQQLYRCFSWWRANPGKEPYLIFPGKQPLDTDFLKGIIERFRDVYGVRVVHMRNDLKVVRPIYTYDWDDRHSFAMRNLDDAAELRQGILNRYKIDDRHDCFSKVRIRIISRRKSRSIQNTQALVQVFEHAFMDEKSAVESVRVTTFEEASFRRQLAFLAQADILIAAHGAELTGIPFLPKCAAVLELFPGGYILPAFYGSLAAVSGVSHQYLYLGHQDMEQEKHVGMRSFESRQAARAASLCPTPEHVVEAVRQLLEKRKACCLESGY